MAPTQVLTMGYSGRTIGTFEKIVLELNATICDVRLWPHTSFTEWDSTVLSEVFHDRYYRLGKYWGNLNYNQFIKTDHGRVHAPIKIADFSHGYQAFCQMPLRPVILLCACRSPDECHRSVIRKELELRGHRCEELTWPKRVAKPKTEPKYLKLVP